MIKAVLFDVGGTLLTVENNDDLRTAFAERLSKRLEDCGIFLNTPYAELGQLLHKNAEEYKHICEESKTEWPSLKIWKDYYLKDFDIPEEKLSPIAEELSFHYTYDREILTKRPNLNKCFDELAAMGQRLGVISNVISTTSVPTLLEEYGIDRYMEIVLLSSETTIRKPDPGMFFIAMEKMGLKAEEIAYVGDTISRDVLGSRNAGLGLCIQITNKVADHRDAAFHGKDAPKPDYLVQDLSEIPDIIRKVNNIYVKGQKNA